MDVARASMRVFGRVVEVGDTFVTRGGPVAVEYTAPSPGGVRIRALPNGTMLTALEVVVTYVHARPYPAWRDTLITIRCASFYMDGEDVWVNVSRGSTRFANVLTDRRPFAGPERRPRPY